MTGKLTVDTETGRLAGPADISYNKPFPTKNSDLGSGAMMGVVMHTMVGFYGGTISEFNNRESGASAFFAVSQLGQIHQFIPVGLGYYSWAQEAGNTMWYSIEFEDKTNPDTPISDLALTAGAQLVECLAEFADFPLQVTDSTEVKGFGVHYMGGVAWGDHPCPDLPPNHVRSKQRAEIIYRASLLRKPKPKPVPPTAPFIFHARGDISLQAVCRQYGVTIPDVLWLTAARDPHGYGQLQGPYFAAGHFEAAMPAGMVIWVGQPG